jgi:geranylgeranyl reductase family protein
MTDAASTIAHVDVLVVGAGPAGTAAAITAHRLGLSVACIDRAHFPRDKTCGDGLTAGALRALEALGVPVPELASAQPVDTAVVRGPAGRSVTLPLPTDGHHAVVARRADLDAALVARARAEGIPVLEGHAVTGVEVRHDEVRICHDTQVTRARFVVAADGHNSAVRRLVNPDHPVDLGTWHAFRQYFGGVEDRRLWVLFEPDLLPGYAWVFPLPGGRANVGFGVLRDASTSGRALAARWRDLLNRPSVRAVLGPRAEPVDRARAWPIPTGFGARRATAGRVLFAGDAAGAVDPMTGEGIAQALESGILAGRAIAGGGPVAAVGARYRAALDRALGRDLRLAARLQRVLRTRAGTSAALALVDLSPWTRRNFARWMFEDYPRALLLTPERWSRGALSPPGAYRRPTQ